MRAVALSDEMIQEKVARHFVPLKAEIPYGTESFPLDWPSLHNWQRAYERMGGAEVRGITGCSVVSPDRLTEYASTGSAFVWEMFDSSAYDAEKFAAMLDSAVARAKEEKAIRERADLDEVERNEQLNDFRNRVKKEVKAENRFRLPPRGFTIEGAKRLFEMSGDLAAAEKLAEEGVQDMEND